jgi:hypothetical protein
MAVGTMSGLKCLKVDTVPVYTVHYVKTLESATNSGYVTYVQCFLKCAREEGWPDIAIDHGLLRKTVWSSPN